MDWVLGRYLDPVDADLHRKSGQNARDAGHHDRGHFSRSTSLKKSASRIWAMLETHREDVFPLSPPPQARALDAQSAGKRMKAESERSLEELQGQLDRLQKQIGDITKGKK
jgi:hypothetical protein